MIDLHRTLSVRYLTQRWVRTFLIVLSIALGVATLVATRALNQSLVTAAEGAVNPLVGASDIIVVNGQTGMSVKLADEMRRASVPGVRAIHPIVSGRVTIPELDNRSVLLLGFGTDVLDDKNKSAINEKWGIKVTLDLSKAEFFGMWAHGPRPILVGGELASDLSEVTKGARPGTFNLAMGDQQTAVRMAGRIVVESEGPAAMLGNNILVMLITDASQVLNPEWTEYVSQINIDVEPGTSPAQVLEAKRRLQEIAGKQAEVRTVKENNESITDVTAGLQLGFALGGVGALVVGLFLVYNVLSVTVAERRHDIGILRSVGATRRQIVGLFLGEASVLGLTGSLLGIPLGLGLAVAAIGPIRNWMSELVAASGESRITVSPSLALVALAAGMLTTVLAAVLPALRASGEEPADAVRRVPLRPSWGKRFLQLGAITLLLGGCVSGVWLKDVLPLRAGAFGGVLCLMVAALLATPLLTGVIGRLIQPLFRNWMGIEGRLAADNLVRSPGRVGLVIAALAATGALLVQTAGFIQSSEKAILDWLDFKVSADLFLTGGSSFDKASLQVPMEETLGDQVKAAFPDDIEAVLAGRIHQLNFRNRIIQLVAVDTTAFPRGDRRTLARIFAHYPELRERRRPQPVLVSDNFASLYHLKRGDRFTVPGRDRDEEVEMVIVDSVEDYLWNRGIVLMDRACYRETFGDHKVDICDLFLKPGADTQAVQAKVAEWGKKRALFVATRSYARELISSGLRQVYSLAYAQQCVVGLVALLGVISALFISVLQRTREFGLLRAVGASRSQILRSVLTEAALMGLIGAVIGLALGFALEWYVLKILLPDEAGFEFPLRFPWVESAVVAVASVGLATLVGMWPAYQATRLRIPEAIAYE